MGSEREADEASSTVPKLQLLFSIPAMESPLHSASGGGGGGMLTPLHTSASVPFQWEEEPGKPRHCTALIPAVSQASNTNTTTTTTTTTTKSLELPPRLQLQCMDSSSKLTKMPSPTTVLDGPYYAGTSSLFQSSSFRFRNGERKQGSFGSSACGSPERGQLGAMVLHSKDRSGFFGSWRRKPASHHRHRRGKKGVGEGSFVFSSSMDFAVDFGGGGGGVDDKGSAGPRKEMSSGIRRNGSFSSLSQIKPHFWATIYEGFKQVLPWKNRKSKKEGLIV